MKFMPALRNLALFFLTTITLLLPSCAQYEAIYSPPLNAGGMRCVNSCLANQQACNNNCHNQKMINDIASSVSNVLLLNQNKYSHIRPGASSSNHDCGCQASYNECYRSCGGNIQYVCVANCRS